jgi:hypothetical protein
MIVMALMRVAGQASATATGRLMLELKAQGEEKGEDEFDKGLAVVKELKVGPFIVEIDGNGAVVASLAGLRMGHPQVKWSVQLMTHNGGIPAPFQGDREGRGLPPLNPMECAYFIKARRRADAFTTRPDI